MKQIELTQGQVALVDDEDFEWLNSFKWYADKSGNTFYARRKVRLNGKRTTAHMHRLIAEKMGFQNHVDHIDHNGLNNQRENLRDATDKQNQENARLSYRNTSGHKGVSWHKGRQKWCARIRHNRKEIHLGYFDNIEDAVEARKKAEQEYFTHA